MPAKQGGLSLPLAWEGEGMGAGEGSGGWSKEREVVLVVEAVCILHSGRGGWWVRRGFGWGWLLTEPTPPSAWGPVCVLVGSKTTLFAISQPGSEEA